MKILLDTHAFLWAVTDDPQLSNPAKELWLDSSHIFLLSSVTGFEISVKYSLGKLTLKEQPREFINNRLDNNALAELPVSLSHTFRLSHLPFHHKDPFDRLLISQALEEDIPILSCDKIFDAYDVERIW